MSLQSQGGVSRNCHHESSQGIKENLREGSQTDRLSTMRRINSQTELSWCNCYRQELHVSLSSTTEEYQTSFGIGIHEETNTGFVCHASSGIFHCQRRYKKVRHRASQKTSNNAGPNIVFDIQYDQV
uniref:Uncharacterized protein n=1 Tax=Cacopsylla melanoneura TaxID=428564 RepID=A0A8D9BGE3_9HEMI